MPPRTIFLVGAPTFSSLQWDESDLLEEPIFPFENSNIRPETSQLYSETKPVKWRLLPGLAVPGSPPNMNLSGQTEGVQFFTVHDFAMSLGPRATGLEDPRLSQFYDHSFTIHETSDISAPGALSGDSTLDSGLWTESIDTSIATNDEREVSAVRPHIQGGITNIEKSALPA